MNLRILIIALGIIQFQVTPALSAEESGVEIIDTHYHCNARTPEGLDLARKWMKLHKVSRIVNHPLKDSRARDEAERARMLLNYAKHAGKIERFTIIRPDEVGTVAEAVKILEQEKKDGAIGFGEHYGYKRMFDDPANMRLYAACAKVGLPVMFHMDRNQNKDTVDFKHLENALKAHPQCTFIAHGPWWWKQFGSGHCSRMLATYPNLYADLSAGSGARALSKDKVYTTGFMKKHHKKLLFGTDCGWWSFKKMDKPAPQFALMRELELSEDIKADIYHRNAKRLFGFDRLGKTKKVE